MTIGPKYAARLLMTCILILTSTTAYACSCASYDTITERVESTSVIFLGEVKKTRKSWSFWRSERKTTFDVIETYKGELSEKMKISHPTGNRGNCGIDFKKKDKLVIFADEDRNGYATSICSFPRKFSDEQIISYLNDGLETSESK